MFCGNCGQQLEQGAVFCSNCGTNVANHSGQGVNHQATTQAATNVHLEKAKDISKGYFSFFMDHVKAPIQHGFSIRNENWINGLITLIIFSLFSGISTYILANSFLSLVGNMFTGGFGVSMSFLSFMDGFIMPLLKILVLLAIVVGLIYLVAKIMKSEANIFDVVARFGTFLLIPSLFIILSFVFIFIKLFSLASLFFAGIALSFILAIILTVYSFSRERQGGLDAYYGMLITFLGLVIVFYILF